MIKSILLWHRSIIYIVLKSMKINYHESDLTLLSVYSCKRQSNFSNDRKIICFELSKENYINLSCMSFFFTSLCLKSSTRDSSFSELKAAVAQWIKMSYFIHFLFWWLYWLEMRCFHTSGLLRHEGFQKN